MLTTAKNLNTFTTTTNMLNLSLTGNVFSNANLNEQKLQSPNSISSSLNPQKPNHQVTSFTL